MKESRVTGLVLLVIGLILLFAPGGTLGMVCTVIGVCLLLGGAAEIAIGFVGTKTPANIVGGGISIVVGVIFLARPDLIISFLPFMVGVVTAAGGLMLIIRAATAPEKGAAEIVTIIGGAVAVIAGIILMVNAYSAAKLLMIVLGIFLIYAGVMRIIRD